MQKASQASEIPVITLRIQRMVSSNSVVPLVVFLYLKGFSASAPLENTEYIKGITVYPSREGVSGHTNPPEKKYSILVGKHTKSAVYKWTMWG